MNGGRGGELGVILATEGRVSSRRGGTQARIRLHVEDHGCKKMKHDGIHESKIRLIDGRNGVVCRGGMAGGEKATAL